MKPSEWIDDHITLRGEEIPIKLGYMPQSDLLFFSENPRVYTILSARDKEPTQEEIERTLSNREHVKQLIHSIRANGGLTDPIFVKDESNIVLEGNSRLAAYRILAKEDPVKWGKIRCKMLPKNIDESKIFSLLGEYHIIGKQDWQPYEQAGYLYRRNKNFGTEPASMAADLGLSTKMVNRLINVYDFMIENNDDDPSRWSYYDEYLKSRKINKARAQYSQLDEVIVKKIKSREIPRASDIRDDLPKICDAGNKVLKHLVAETKSFQECVDRAISGGADEHCYKNLKKFRIWLVDNETRQDFSLLPENITKKVRFEFKKIKSGIDHINKTMQN